MEPNEVRVEACLLCRSLEIVDNALSILGGGWSTIGFFGFPGVLQSFYVAVRLIVPFTETNYELEFEVRLEDGDGHNVLPHPLRPKVTVGRPVDLLRGEEQPVHLPLSFHDIEIPHAGIYIVRFIYQERELARTSMTAVHIAPGMTPQSR
jgi:hypothetical protein